MRATKGYVAGLGTSSALVGAIGCAFAILSAVVAVHGWPLALGAPGTSTVDGRGAATEAALPSLEFFPTAPAADAPGARHASAGAGGQGADERVVPAGPVASAYGPATGDRSGGTHGAAGGGTLASAPATAAGSSGSAGPGISPTPSSGGGSSTPPPPSRSGAGSGAGSTTLGGTVTQVTSGAGTAVAQTGQQLGGVVQGATSQLGDAVGQVSPAAGQVVTQTGQAAGGVVSGATTTVGGVVTGAGTTAGGLLGGLTGSR